ncbi:glycosyltransferase family 4 protein [Nocardioides sp. SR21]|uniref:glycosyltransferase family 4 protein n=1 Tax=Nocardioides sp. SR21 TaxID=2919501 RepID=UPI001FAACFDC|nr:glycosyltransferase family 4 protein [Nocardioides sp. SR21]
MQGGRPERIRGRHVVFFNWRDTANPEGGGSERYVESMARGVVRHGGRATIFCAAHGEAPSEQTVDGVRYVREGDHVMVYLRGLWNLARRRFGKVDVVVDVQNGLPFFTRLGTRRPVVVLVHHVHREQWPIVFPGLMGTVGWFIERRLAPVLYRRSQYIAVSRATRNELVELGVGRERIAVVHNGTAPPPVTDARKSAYPSIVVVSRLVPHKQIEHAIDAVAALRSDHPDIRLTIVGSGWWEDDLRKHAADAGVGDVVSFEGFVTEARKHEVLAESWLMLLPSVKEGWGLVIGEAGSHRVPTIAYTSAGGTRESIAHLRSGLLVEDEAELISATRRLLEDAEERERLGTGALEMSHTFSWTHSQDSFAHVLSDVLAGQRVSVEDPDGP